MSLSEEDFKKLPVHIQAKLSSLEELAEQAQMHVELGDKLSYPQIERWDSCSERYLVDILGDGSYACCSYKNNGRWVLSWTPYEDIAQMLIARSRKCGWKYKDSCVVKVTDHFLKANPTFRFSTFAGFHPTSIERDGQQIVIVSASKSSDDRVAKTIAEG